MVVDLTQVSDGNVPSNNGVNSQKPIHQSDLAMYGGGAMWINGTHPIAVGDVPVPNNSFPFTRLASINSADQSATFLYHQINGTTLAEEQWDDLEEVWIATVYITVSDS